MPESATITTFHVFSAGGKAKASEMNTNFSNFRGHLIPIDPNTAAAAGSTYDLGASDHKWRRVYVVRGSAESTVSSATLTSSGVFTAVSQDFTGLSFTITTYGRPVQLGLRGAHGLDSGITVSNDANTGTADCNFYFMRDSTTLTMHKLGFLPIISVNALTSIHFPYGSIQDRDTPTAGTYTYKLVGKVNGPHSGNVTVSLTNIKIYAEETLV